MMYTVHSEIHVIVDLLKVGTRTIY
jgi:hypothetical protein